MASPAASPALIALRTPAAGPEFEELDRASPRRLGAGEASAGKHDAQRCRDACLVQPVRQHAEIACHQRLHIGVRRRRRHPLVFAGFGSHARRDADAHLGEGGPQRVRHLLLVRGVGIGMQQADGERLELVRFDRAHELDERSGIERFDDPAVDSDALVDLEAPLRRDQRLRKLDIEIVEIVAQLARYVGDVTRPFRDDEARARAVPFDERVGHERGGVNDIGHLAGSAARIAGPDLAQKLGNHRGNAFAGIVRGGEALANPYPTRVAVFHNAICERPANVHGDSQLAAHSMLLRFHSEAFDLIAKAGNGSTRLNPIPRLHMVTFVSDCRDRSISSGKTVSQIGNMPAAGGGR